MALRLFISMGLDFDRGGPAQGFVSPSRQPLQPLGLRQQDATQAPLDLLFGARSSIAPTP